jgi:hypothetical protein
VEPIDRLLQEAWIRSNDDTARRNFLGYRRQLQEVQGYLVHLDHMIETMLRDKKLDFRKFDQQEQDGGDYVHQCIHAACAELQGANSRLLRFYNAERGGE